MEKKSVENKNYNIIMGIDLSLTGAGISVIEKKSKNILHQELISTKKKKTKKLGEQTQLAIFDKDMNIIEESFIPSSVLVDMPRLSFIRNRIRNLILKFKPDLVIIEGYALHGFGRGASGLMEIGGIIRMTIFDLNIPYIQVPPLNAKAFISGFSTASKEMVISSIYESYDVLIENDNIADSFSLAMMYIELGEQLNEYIIAGGVDKLKNLKIEEIRKNSNKIISFKKLLKMGEINQEDVSLALNQITHLKKEEKAELLGISIEHLNQISSEKPRLSKFNDLYRFKKPSKKSSKKNQNSDDEH